MSILEIVLMVMIGVGTAVWCAIMIIKCVRRKRNIKVAKKVEQDESSEEIRE